MDALLDVPQFLNREKFTSNQQPDVAVSLIMKLVKDSAGHIHSSTTHPEIYANHEGMNDTPLLVYEQQIGNTSHQKKSMLV